MKNIILLVLLLASSTLFGQVGNCDSLTVLDVKLNPFDTDQIMVRSAYTDFDHFISYPGFTLVDDQEFTLAWEEVNFFGMSIEQIHQLDILNLEVPEGAFIPATLELWSFNYDFLECVIPGGYVLWPAEECTPLTLTFNMLQTDSAYGSIDVKFFDAAGVALDSLSLSLDSAGGLFNYPICLPKDCDYQLSIQAQEINEEGVTYSLQYRDFLAVGAHGTLLPNATATHDFDVYGCMFTGMEKEPEKVFLIYPNPANSIVQLQVESGSAIAVYSSTGTRVFAAKWQNSTSPYLQIDCSSWLPGIYFVAVQSDNGSYTTQKLAVTR